MPRPNTLPISFIAAYHVINGISDNNHAQVLAGFTALIGAFKHTYYSAAEDARQNTDYTIPKILNAFAASLFFCLQLLLSSTDERYQVAFGSVLTLSLILLAAPENNLIIEPRQQGPR